MEIEVCKWFKYWGLENCDGWCDRDGGGVDFDWCAKCRKKEIDDNSETETDKQLL